MANFNTGKIYNKTMISGGANYNSGPFIVVIIDSTKGTDIVTNVTNNVDVNDNGYRFWALATT